MPQKIYNIYCDESCHLKNDYKQYMFLGNVSCLKSQVKRHSERIKDIKRKHNFYAEIKWSHVSLSKIQFYLDLVDYFFDTDLCFRTIAVEKKQICTENFGFTFDEFYYKMYYQLLNYKLDTTSRYNVFIDIKDTWSNTKVMNLKKILNVKYGVFSIVQPIRSHESLLLQLADFLMGAISYNANNKEKKNAAKVKVIERIKQHGNIELLRTNNSDKFNLFFIQLR